MGNKKTPYGKRQDKLQKAAELARFDRMKDLADTSTTSASPPATSSEDLFESSTDATSIGPDEPGNSVDGSSEDELPPTIILPPRMKALAKQGTKRKSAEEQVEQGDIQNIILLVPEPGSAPIQRVSLDSSVPFDTALATIYEILTCTNVVLKPRLAYKLSSEPVKAPPIRLATSSDWEGMREQLAAAQMKKRKPRSGVVPTAIPVNIIVPEEYMLGLQKRGKKAKHGSSMVFHSGSTKTRKPAIRPLDLDADAEDNDGMDDDDDGNEDDNDLRSQEKKQLMLLKARLGGCARCGPEKACKINRVGVHVPLTFNQLSAWANALALQTHGVTLQTPPNTKAFAAFYKTSTSEPTAPLPANILPGANGSMLYPMFDPRMFLFPPHLSSPYGAAINPNEYPLLPTPTNEQPKPADPKDDLDDPDVEYPSCNQFFADLALRHLSRRAGIDSLLARLAAEDVLNINEVAGLSSETLRKDFGLSIGNERFIRDEIKKEMKRVNLEHYRRDDFY